MKKPLKGWKKALVMAVACMIVAGGIALGVLVIWELYHLLDSWMGTKTAAGTTGWLILTLMLMWIFWEKI